MADDGFNGSTISFDSNDQTPLVSIDYNGSCGTADVTGAADSEHTFEPGIPDESVEWEIVGKTTLAIGDEGATAVSWNDGDTTLGTFTNAVIVGVRTGGGEGGAKTTVITARPTAA